jgi:integrase
MARVYRHEYKGGRLSKKWYVELRIRGKVIRRVGYVSKKATERLAADLEREHELIHAGVLPSQTAELRRQLTELLDEWEAAIVARGSKPETAKLKRFRVGQVADGCGWARPGDCDGEAAQRWLAGEQRAGRLAARTVCHYAGDLSQFGRWCVPRRLATNPFAHLARPNPDADRRHVRRTIPAEDLARVIAAARSGRVAFDMAGPDRAALYLLAAYSGYRASELAALERDALAVGDSPVVVLGAEYTKNGKPAQIPVPGWVADDLRAWLGVKNKGPLWPGRWAVNRWAGKMLRVDLGAAGVPYDVGGEVFDFHALRGFYATELYRAGVPLQAAQKLMRHSTPTLTANLYARLGMGDLAAEVAKLKRPA